MPKSIKSFDASDHAIICSKNSIGLQCFYFAHRPNRNLIVNPRLLKRHSKSKRRAPAYPRALREIRGFFQRIVHGKLRFGCQTVRGGKLDVKAGVVRRVGRNRIR